MVDHKIKKESVIYYSETIKLCMEVKPCIRDLNDC